MKITVEADSVDVLIRSVGADCINIKLKDDTAFPNLADRAYMTVYTQKGIGVQWCRDVLGVEPSITDGDTGKRIGKSYLIGGNNAT